MEQGCQTAYAPGAGDVGVICPWLTDPRAQRLLWAWAVALLPGCGNAYALAGNDPMYSQVVAHLKNASIPVRELHGRGHVAVTLAAGRIVALAFAQDGPNLLWSNPELGNTNLVKAAPDKLAGGFGGDRLWFSPELRYHWHGKPDWRGLSNYQVPKDTDPGHYVFLPEGPSVIALSAKGRLAFTGSDQYLDFAVERRIRFSDPPIPLNDPLLREVAYVGVETSHALSIDPATKSGEIDLWHLLQAPVDSILIVPLRPGHRSGPLSYGLVGDWQNTPTALIWRYGGKANAKIGIAAEALTGRSAILRKLASGLWQWCLIVRQFPVDTAAHYGDHPAEVSRDDQVFQAWDGSGFGEMEYHSPVLNAEHGPRTLQETDHLWVFGGSARSIRALAKRLLGTDIQALIREHG